MLVNNSTARSFGGLQALQESYFPTGCGGKAAAASGKEEIWGGFASPNPSILEFDEQGGLEGRRPSEHLIFPLVVGGEAAHHQRNERCSEGLRPSKPPA